MSKIRLTGSNSGYVEIASAADAGNLTFVLPTSGTSLLGNGHNVYTGITTFSNDLKLEGTSYDVLWDASDNQLEFDDNAILSFGGSSDLQLYHTGNHAIIKNGTGNLILQDDQYIVLEKLDGTNMLVAAGGGSVDLYFNGSKKIETAASGAIVSGIMTATEINYTGDQNLSNRNKIINGAMTISQRGTSFSPGDSDDIYTLDRFEHFATSGANGNSTITHSEDHPDGFKNSYKITPDTTNTPSASGNVGLRTKIEGQDLQDLAFATSSAKKLTLSFYAKSAAQNSGHQYTVQLRKFASSGQDADRRSVNSAFTVTDSWQRFTFTFDGDTSKDVISNNALGIELVWILNSGPDDITSAYPTWSAVPLFSAVTGQSNFMDNTSNYFYLTGVQLEIGSVATPFEHRSFIDEYLRCCRYYFGGANTYVSGSNYYGSVYSSGNSMVRVPHPVPMRSTPTASQPSQSGGGTFSQVYENSCITQYYFSGDVSVSVPASEVDISSEL